MRRAVVCGGLLALAFTSARLEAADTTAGGAALTPAEAKGSRDAKRQKSRPSMFPSNAAFASRSPASALKRAAS